MGSDGDRSQVTLQIQLASDRSKKSVQTELDLTVKEFKLVLADLTGIPSDRQYLVYKGHILENSQTLRSYELERDQIIYLVRTALPPSKPVVSLSRNSTATSPGKTNGLNATNVSHNRPQIQPLNENLDVRAIIKSIPILCAAAQEPKVAKMLENPVILRCVLSYLFSLEINRGKASDGADLTENIKAQTEGSHKLECMYDGLQGNSLGSLLDLMGLNLVGTSDSEPESSTTNSSDLALNTDPLLNPLANGTCLSEMEQARGSDELVEAFLRHDAHNGAIDNFVQILFSDDTFLRHYKKQGESIDCAITAMLGWDDPSPVHSSSGVSSIGTLLNGHCSPYQKLVLALPNDVYYNSSCSSNGTLLNGDCSPYQKLLLRDSDSSCSSSDSSVGFALEDESEELLALQLVEMEEMGFMNCEENLRALLKSGADVEQAVERLLEKTYPEG